MPEADHVRVSCSYVKNVDLYLHSYVVMAGMENTGLSHRSDEYRSRPCYESTVPRCMRRMTSLNCSQSMIDDPWLVYRREGKVCIMWSFTSRIVKVVLKCCII